MAHKGSVQKAPAQKQHMRPLPKQMDSHMKQKAKANRYAKVRPAQAQG